MTLPTLVQNYQEKARITKLKKIHAQLQNAFNLAVVENGSPDTWNLAVTNTEVSDENGNLILDHSGQQALINKLIVPYFKPANVDKISLPAIFSLDGRLASEASGVQLKEEDYDGAIFMTHDGYILEPGWIAAASSSKISDFWVFLPNEKERKIGVTYFNFYLSKQKGFIPEGNTQSTFSNKCRFDDKSIASNQNGRGCTYWALTYENMDYLRCSDLNFNTKTKCK